MTHYRSIVRALALGAGVLTTALTGCAVDKSDDVKGVVDDSAPPSGDPKSDGAGKADDGRNIVPVDVQSPHPYANNMDELYRIDIDEEGVPWCAWDVRAHFASIQVEDGYDRVHVTGGVTEQLQSWTGNHTDVWTDWINVGHEAGERYVDVTLDTDYSITRHGFEIDQLEWQGSPICPAVVYPPCEAGYVDITPPPGACSCPTMPTCVAANELVVRHGTQRGFMNTGHKTIGTDAFSYAPGPVDAPVDTRIGSVEFQALFDYVRRISAEGLLTTEGYQDYSGETNEWFSIVAGEIEVTFVAPQGEHVPEVAAAIDAFEGLFTCGAADEALTCEGDYSCLAGSCEVDAGCFCTEQYDPVCGTNGRTFGNACKAGCANIPVAHAGECGIAADMCGGLLGLPCLEDHKCRFGEGVYTYPYPDAGGYCVAEDYCDVPADCDGLPHIAVPGAFECQSNQCVYVTGQTWRDFDFEMQTPHPYANNRSEWKQLYLTDDDDAMRLVGQVELENGYDFLDVWTWIDGSWQRVKRYTGTPDVSADEFPGRYHYLHFVSDYSVTAYGVDVTAQVK